MPTISSISLTSNGPSQFITAPNAAISLTFTVVDNLEVPTAPPTPLGWVVAIGPQGSLLPTLQSTSPSTLSRFFSYNWNIPASATYNTLGYFLNVSDTAGNFRSLRGTNTLTLGKSMDACVMLHDSIHQYRSNISVLSIIV